MSLTSFIKNPDVRKKFKDEFPRQPVPRKKEPIAPPLTKHYALVGTAFDYLLRFYLKRLNPKAKTSRWVAEMVPDLLVDDERLQKKAQRVVADAKKAYAHYLKSGKIDKRLLKSVLSLAQLDPIYRSGTNEFGIGKSDELDLQDLKALISLVDPRLFKAKKVIVLNPTFGSASDLVGGADADMLIDNTLIDVKTTKELKVRRDSYNQLIGYYILATIGGISGVRRNHSIERLGFYYSRFGELYTFNVKDAIDPGRFRSFVRWFRDRAEEEELMGFS
jgi:hypothetical protein